MSLTIEQIEEQIMNLQKTLDELKKPRLEVSREFTGHYFAPYQGVSYRRMESEGVPIWENFIDIEKKWVMLSSSEMKKFEKLFLKECSVEDNPEE